MPGYILHMLHGDMILKKGFFNFSEDEIKKYRAGILMPDSNKEAGCRPDFSHFTAEKCAGFIMKYPDMEVFAEKYSEVLENPFVTGYAAHLFLDYRFFSTYFNRCVRFLDSSGNETELSSEAVSAYIIRMNKTVTIDELFSEEYLYGDYTMLNKYLVKKYCMQKTQYTEVNNPIREVDMKNFTTVLKAQERYLNDSSGSTDMKLFDVSDLEGAFMEYAEEFITWFKQHL